MRPKRQKEPEYQRLLAQERLILDTTEAIVGLLEEEKVSRQELAQRLGKSKGFVSQLLSGERNMTLRTLADLGYVLDRRFSLAAYAGDDQSQLGEGVQSGDLGDEKPTDQESRADTPAEAAEESTHDPGADDSHEYALAA
jgi:transcriptional regulator with XRE-family HTH domain